MAIAIATIMVLATLNYSRFMTVSQEEERKKHAQAMKAAAQLTTSVRHASTQGLAEEALLAPDGVTSG